MEPRELLSALGAAAPRAHVARASHGRRPQPADFHKEYTNLLTARFQASANSTQRIDTAFQAFIQNALGVPVADQGKSPSVPPPSGNGGGSPGGNPPGGPPASAGVVPVGTVPAVPSLENFLNQLDSQVALALSTYIPTTTRVQPSIRDGPKFTPNASQALIPYAHEQIAALGQSLRAQPPTFKADGTLADPAPLEAVNTAFNAILNAEAENSVHPRLFRKPADFYINPAVRFSIPFTSTPAQAGPGYYVHGAGGVPLAGSARHRR